MDKEAVFLPHFQRNLTNRLNKWLRFNITDGTANFRDDHISIGGISQTIDELFDLIGDMRDNLHR